MRKSKQGGVRDDSLGKLDYSFYEPRVEQLKAEYLLKHAHTKNGFRPVDNWQAGMFGVKEDMKSLARHFKDLEAINKGYRVFKEKRDNKEITHYFKSNIKLIISSDYTEVTFEEACCAIEFNINVIMNDHLLGLK